MVNVSHIAKDMIAYSNGNLHDINHFLKVFSYAQIIGKQECLDPEIQETLEIAALLHDIACPLCRKKYGNTNGKYQEAEGVLLAEAFLKDQQMPEEMKKRVIYLVGHHHTYTAVDGNDYQILLEADYLVNAEESSYSKDNIKNAMEQIFQTKAGKELLQSIYQI
jgi:HD superfamily phosphodiesterase